MRGERTTNKEINLNRRKFEHCQNQPASLTTFSGSCSPSNLPVSPILHWLVLNPTQKQYLEQLRRSRWKAKPLFGTEKQVRKIHATLLGPPPAYARLPAAAAIEFCGRVLCEQPGQLSPEATLADTGHCLKHAVCRRVSGMIEAAY